MIQADPGAPLGSVVLQGTGPDCDAGFAIRVRKSRFVTIRGLNISGGGKGISLIGGAGANDSIQIERNRIFGNGCGDAIAVENGNTNTVIANNLIYGSPASGVDLKGSGGPTHVIENTIDGNAGSGVLLSPGVQADLVNNAITHNNRGIRRRGGASDPALILLKNNLVCGNPGGEIQASLLDANDSANQTPTGSEGVGVVASAGCDDEATLYRDVDGTDGIAGSTDDDYVPADGSPLVDRGLNPKTVTGLKPLKRLFNRDYAANKGRPKDGNGDASAKYDIGAYEHSAATPTPTPIGTSAPTPTPTGAGTPTPTPQSPTPTPSHTPVPTPPCSKANVTISTSYTPATPPERVSGVTVFVDYPETRLSIPGCCQDPTVQARVTNLSGVTGTFSAVDTDDKLNVDLLNLSTAIPPGNFAKVQFDCLAAPALPTVADFSCTSEVSDFLSGNLRASTCSVVSVVTTP